MTVQAAPEGHSYLFPLRGASLYFVCVCVGRCPGQLGHPVPTAAVIGLGGLRPKPVRAEWIRGYGRRRLHSSGLKPEGLSTWSHQQRFQPHREPETRPRAERPEPKDSAGWSLEPSPGPGSACRPCRRWNWLKPSRGSGQNTQEVLEPGARLGVSEAPH